MAPSLTITIPTTSTSSGAKPYTVYTLSLRQPLRSWTLQKRYSDFTTLHSLLTTQCFKTAPPKALPQKSWWFKSTVSDPSYAESRRRELEEYMQAINNDRDARWRNTQAWRTFLNLPFNPLNSSLSFSSATNFSSSAVAAAVTLATSNPALQASITDPSTWLDVHRELKTLLRDARLALTRRDAASTTQAQYEASTEAKRHLARCDNLLAALDRGLSSMSGTEHGNGNGRAGRRGGGGDRNGAENEEIVAKLGDGEIRRRRDLLGSAKKEKEALDSVLSTFTPKQISSSSTPTTSAEAPAAAKSDLFSSTSSISNTAHPTRGRILGAKETDRTRELDNTGVLQVQKQIMQEQDADVTDLTKVVGRMKEMGVQINEELVLQNEMLGLLDQDVDRVGDKIEIAKKRIAKIR